MARISDVRVTKESYDNDQTTAQMQDSKPPPPPGGEDLWELQFCRWWGWNWVRKQEPETRNTQSTAFQCDNYEKCDNRYTYRNQSPGPPVRKRKVKKKHVWDFCKSLCCKKRRDDTKLQALYTTPSNSTTMCKINRCGKYRQDTITELEEARNLSRKQRQSPCCQRQECTQSLVKVKHQWSGSSSVEYSYRPSSTDESVEFLNISCGCHCQRRANKIEEPTPKRYEEPIPARYEEPMPKRPADYSPESLPLCDCQDRKCPCNKQPPVKNTSDGKGDPGLKPKQLKKCCNCSSATTVKCDGQTQTTVGEAAQTVKTESKKKRRLVVTCHCCCCKCLETASPQKAKPEKNTNLCICPSKVASDSRSPTNEKPEQIKNERISRVASHSQHSTNEKRKQTKNELISSKIPEKTIQNQVIEQIMDHPLNLNKYFPWDSSTFDKKEFPRYGFPSKGRPLLQYTKSDISDKFYSLKIDEEFSSPVSGKTYDLSPLKPDYFDSLVNKRLPELLEVDDEMKYLRKLESEAKMDLSSRVMLDAMCDAVLNNNQDIGCFSRYMNQLTYDHNDILHGKQFSSYLSDSSTSELLLKESYGDPLIDNSTVFQQNAAINVVDEVDKLVENLLKTRKSNHAVNIENILCKYGIKRASDKTKYTNDTFLLKATENSCEGCSYSKNPPNFPVSPNEKSNKRPASPIPDMGIKKSKTENRSDSHLNVNLNDIFKKIDIIALKSQENDMRINQVLGSLQKGEYENTLDTPEEHNFIEKPQEILNKINGMVQKNQFGVTKFEFDIPASATTGSRNTSIRTDNVLEEHIERNSEKTLASTSKPPATDQGSRGTSKSRPTSKDGKKATVTPKKKEQSGQSLIPVKRPSRFKGNKKK